MRAMIMAAGLGTRLRPLTSLISKPMAPILNRPALYHILELLKRHGITEVVMNIHYFPETITGYFGDGSELGMSVRYAYEPELLGTAGGVKNNEAFLRNGTFIVMSGDALTDLDLDAALATHREKGGIATLAVKEVDDPSEYGVMIADGRDRVTGFQEKPQPEEALSNLCNAGIYVFEPEIFDRIPPNSFYDFGRQVLPELVEDDIPFYVHRIAGYWNDVGSLYEYRQGNFDALEERVKIERPGVELRPGVLAGPRSYVSEEARVDGRVLLGAHCRVEGAAEIRGPVVLGDYCVVEDGACVSRSVVWNGVRVGAGAKVADSTLASHVSVWPEAEVRHSVVGDRAAILPGAAVRDGRVDTGSFVAEGARVEGEGAQ
ncbi:MAG: hypothetical protein Kow00129_11020 [Thermoleophilia bacterium]